MPIGWLAYIDSEEHPATRYLGTTWEKIEDVFIKGTKSGEASGQTGGSNTKTISKANLPNVKLQVDSFSLGKGTQEITGNLTYNSGLEVLGCSGAFSYTTYSTGNANGHSGAYGANGRNISFTASKTWTGMSTSASPFTEALGSGTPLDITPAYYTVHIWKRLS